MNSSIVKILLGSTLILVLLLSVAFRVESPPPTPPLISAKAVPIPMPPRELAPDVAWKCSVNVTSTPLVEVAKIRVGLNKASIVVIDWGDNTPLEAYKPGTALTYYEHDYSQAGPGTYLIEFKTCAEHVDYIRANFAGFTKLTALDVVGLSELTYLNVATNELSSSLDLTSNSSLRELYINSNTNLSSLDVTDLDKLEILQGGLCSLTGTMNLTTCPALRIIKLGNNDLTGLNISGLTNLEQVFANGNDIAGTIDISSSLDLWKVNLESNEIEYFTLPNSQNSLKEVSIQTNDLGKSTAHPLDFTKSPDLEILQMNNNDDIENLQIQGLSNLITLKAGYCKIENDQDLSGCVALEVADYTGNTVATTFNLLVNGANNLTALAELVLEDTGHVPDATDPNDKGILSQLLVGFHAGNYIPPDPPDLPVARTLNLVGLTFNSPPGNSHGDVVNLNQNSEWTVTTQ